MSAAIDIAAAEAERHAARARLQSTLVLVRARLAPSAIARRKTDELKRRAAETGEQAANQVREHPAAAAGAVATLFAAGALLFARRRSRRARVSERGATDISAVATGFGHVPDITQTLKERE